MRTTLVGPSWTRFSTGMPRSRATSDHVPGQRALGVDLGGDDDPFAGLGGAAGAPTDGGEEASPKRARCAV